MKKVSNILVLSSGIPERVSETLLPPNWVTLGEWIIEIKQLNIFLTVTDYSGAVEKEVVNTP